jgi:hypothetical protein
LLGFLLGESGNFALIALDDALGESLAALTMAMSILTDVTFGLPDRARDLKSFCSWNLFIVLTTAVCETATFFALVLDDCPSLHLIMI